MRKLKLTNIAPYSGKRVQPFDGIKRYMSTGDLKGENLSFEDVTYKSKPSRADIIVQKGDILFAKMTNTNKALMINSELDGIIVSTGFSVHKPIENKLFSEYFLHFLKHESFHRQKNKLCTGAIQSAISNSGIEKIFVPVPDYSDQLHIANLLSKAETLINQRKESIRLLDQYLKSTFFEMFGDPSTNRKKFQKGAIRDVVTEVKYGTSSPAEDNGLYPYLRMNNITYDGYMDYSKLKYINIIDDREKEKYIVRKGDLLFNRTNSKELVGKSGVFNEESEMIIAGYLIRIRTNEKANPWFLWGYLNSIHGKQTLLGMCKSIVGMANINAQELQGIKILIPPLTLQTQFAQIVEKTEALKTQYQQSLQELEQLYGSLSQKAFKGELTIKEKFLSQAAEPSMEYKKSEKF